MPPRAFAVSLPIALAAWLAPFLGGCSGAEESSPPAVVESAEAGPVAAHGIRYVTHKVQPASDYRRISEYFTGYENTGGNLVVRTSDFTRNAAGELVAKPRPDPNDRRGLYFILAPDYFDKLPDGATAVVELVSSEKNEPKKFYLPVPPLPDAGLFKEIRLGVTGADWPEEKKPKLVAWKITLRDPKTGAVLATAQSFLWSLPKAEAGK